MRNKIFYLATLFLAGCIATGCTDEQRGNIGTPAQAGEPVRFSVDAPQSRTDYVGQEGDKWILKWMTDDEIGICTTADIVTKVSTTGDNEKKAVYTVLPIDEPGPHQYHGDLSYHEENHLIWKKEATDDELNTTLCTFYGAYPASRITGYPINLENRYFEMAYYTNQTVKIDNPTDNSGVYTTSPDMDNAYMIARKNIYPNGDHILLDFDPIMTTLDITVTAGRYEVATGIINPVTVTGVSVIMPSKLQDGKITYDTEGMEAEGVTGKLKEGTWITGHTEPVFVGFDEYTDKNGNQRRSVDLHPGESINLMAFLPPIPMGENSGAKIRVHALGGLNFVMTVTPAMLEQHRIYVQLPDISPESENELMVNNWISQLDGDIPLKQLSIPGATCSKHDTDADDAEEVTSLLKMGIRAFNMDALFIQQKNQLGISINKYKLSSAVAMALKSFFDENENEFVIIWLDDESLGTGQKYDTDKLLTNYWTEPTENNFTQWKVTNVNNKLLVIKRNYYNSGDLEMHRYMINADDTPYQVNQMDHLCKWWNVNEMGDFKSSGEWGVQFVNDGSLNKSIYESIVSSSAQSGFTGIVMVPNAGETFINGQYTYSDLLIQAIIDCNYKFH